CPRLTRLPPLLPTRLPTQPARRNQLELRRSTPTLPTARRPLRQTQLPPLPSPLTQQIRDGSRRPTLPLKQFPQKQPTQPAQRNRPVLRRSTPTLPTPLRQPPRPRLIRLPLLRPARQ